MANYTVILDPGHQNYPYLDTGASGFGLKEEDITLDICKRIKPLLEQNNIKVILTREGDYVNGGQSSVNSSLQARVKISNTIKPDIFISLHANAFNGNAYGSEVHICSKGGKAEKLANCIVPKLGEIFYNRGLKVSPNLYVLKYTDAPAVLLECGFIDNKSDNAKLANVDIRQQIAKNISQGVCEYFEIKNIKSTQEQNINNNNQGSDFKMDVCIVYFSSSDFSSALILSNKFGGCAMFCRNGSPNVHPDALKSAKIFTVGGPKLNVNGEIYLSGNTAQDTLIKVADYLQGK